MTLRTSPSILVQRAEASGQAGLLLKAPHWGRAKLGDAAKIVNGAPFRSDHFNNDAQGMPLIRIRDVGSPSTSTWYNGEWSGAFLVTRGDLLIGMDGEFRSATWQGEDGLLNQRVCKIVVDENIFVPKFVELVLPGYLDLIWQATSSVTVKHLSSRSIADIPLPHPSLSEQRRIIDVLEDHLSRLAAAESLLSAGHHRLQHLRGQLIKNALIGAGEPGERHTARLLEAGTSDGSLEPLPDGWSWARLGDVAEVVGGITKDSKKQADGSLLEVPYLRVANVQRGHLDLTKVATIRADPNRASALRLRRGDVLLNEGGDRNKLARGWVWEGQLDHCIHQNHVFRARLQESRLNPYFLSWTANTFGGRWAEQNGKQSVNLASISLSKIRLMPVIVPPEGRADWIVEQLKVQLSSTESLGLEVERQTVRASHLRRAVLTAAFSGRLTGRSTDTEVIEELAG